MKKLICLMMSLIMVLGLCACGGSGNGKTTAPETTGVIAPGPSEAADLTETTAPADTASQLMAGFGRVSIVPDFQVQLAGGAATRYSESYTQDDLAITCVALRENDETFLLYTMDVICAEDVFVDPTKGFVSSATGVPESNILMNATHTHAGPAIRSNGSRNVDQYRAAFYLWAEEAAVTAIEDLAPVTVSCGSIEAPGMAWVRHYVMNDGTYSGANFGSTASGYKGHVEEADVELQLIRFAREDKEKKDIVLMNFPAHATMTQSATAMSADFPFAARTYVESENDCHVAYFIAAAGNQVPTSRISTEQFSSDYQVFGEELGRYAVMGLDNNMKEVDASGIAFKQKTFTAPYNKEKLDQLPAALMVKAKWAEVGRASTAGSQAAKAAGFASVYEVSAIIDRSSAPDTNSMEIKVLALGDVSFIFAPYEMFGSHGRTIKDNSPYEDMTFIITCAEGAEGYLPSLLGWEIGTYESHVSRYERGTGEKLADEFVAMLTEIKG